MEKERSRRFPVRPTARDRYVGLPVPPTFDPIYQSRAVVRTGERLEPRLDASVSHKPPIIDINLWIHHFQ